MMAQLIRIDAFFEARGGRRTEVTLFAGTEVYRREIVSRQQRYGWDIRETVIDADAAGLARQTLGALIGPVWPNWPLEELVDLVRDGSGGRRGEDRWEPRE